MKKNAHGNQVPVAELGQSEVQKAATGVITSTQHGRDSLMLGNNVDEVFNYLKGDEQT